MKDKLLATLIKNFEKQVKTATGQKKLDLQFTIKKLKIRQQKDL